MTRKESSDDFDFEVGDRVLVRVREHGQSGRMKGKFVGVVDGFRGGVSLTPDKIVIDPPWGGSASSSVVLSPHDAELETVSGEVSF